MSLSEERAVIKGKARSHTLRMYHQLINRGDVMLSSEQRAVSIPSIIMAFMAVSQQVSPIQRRTHSK